jgi:hypothetical protein
VILNRLGWNAAKQAAYIEARAGNSEGFYSGELRSRGGVFLQKVGVLGGQVDVSAEGRRCRADLKNDRGQIGVSQETLLKSRLILTETTFVPGHGLLEVPIGDGPIVTAEPGDAVISVTTRGFGDLAQNNLLESKTLRQGHLTVNAIRTVLEAWSGIPSELIKLPHLPHTLPRNQHHARGAKVWPIAVALAESVNMDLTVGPDHIFMREFPTDSCFDWVDQFVADRDGLPVTVVTAPKRTQTTRDENGEHIPNWVIVYGNQRAHGHPQLPHVSPQVVGQAFAQASSVNGSGSQGINNVPHYYLREFTNETIRTYEGAHNRARSYVEQFESLAQSVTFEGKTLPIFDYLDRVTVQTKEFVAIFNMRDFSFSFGGQGDSATMSVGWNRKLSTAGSKITGMRR